MKLTDNYFQARKEAMKWLNVPPLKRDFNKGLAILQKSGYKPSVVDLLIRNGEKPWTREKLKYCMRQMLEVYYNPDDPRFNDEDVDVLNAKSAEVKDPDVDISEITEETKSFKEKPTQIQKVMKLYADAHKRRDKANRQRSELPEKNDEETVKKRKMLSEAMDADTAKMEALWALRERYDKDNTLPTDEEIEKAVNTPNTQRTNSPDDQTTNPSEDYSQLDTKTLRTRRNSTRTLLTRKQNLLLYQKTSKQKTPNPLPDCPKKVRLEKDVEKLTAELTKMEYELAKRD